MREWLSLLGHTPANKKGEKWYERDAGDARLAYDRKIIAGKYPSLKYALNFQTFKAILQGEIVLREENSGIPTPIKIKIVFPDNYPDNEPTAMDSGNDFVHIADRHFHPNGACCLWLPMESQWNKKDENTLLNFIDQLAIFYERQLIYDSCGYWVWGERGHGEKGFIEYFGEILGGDGKTVEAFLPVLSNDTFISNKAKCPCGSNRNYNLCHRRKVEFIKNSFKN